nr:hypothetical protein [uncultured Acinetobacter sp.]
MNKKDINCGQAKARRKKEIWDKLKPDEQEKVTKLRTLLKVHFRNQTLAAEKLGVLQSTISRYLSGEIPISEKAASILVDLSEGTVTLEELRR